MLLIFGFIPTSSPPEITIKKNLSFINKIYNSIHKIILKAYEKCMERFSEPCRIRQRTKKLLIQQSFHKSKTKKINGK